MLDKSLGLLIVSALAIGTMIGVLFQFVYPGIGISVELGSLFALAGLLLALVLRGGWKALRRRRLG